MVYSWMELLQLGTHCKWWPANCIVHHKKNTNANDQFARSPLAHTHTSYQFESSHDLFEITLISFFIRHLLFLLITWRIWMHAYQSLPRFAFCHSLSFDSNEFDTQQQQRREKQTKTDLQIETRELFFVRCFVNCTRFAITINSNMCAIYINQWRPIWVLNSTRQAKPTTKTKRKKKSKYNSYHTENGAHRIGDGDIFQRDLFFFASSIVLLSVRMASIKRELAICFYLLEKYKCERFACRTTASAVHTHTNTGSRIERTMPMAKHTIENAIRDDTHAHTHSRRMNKTIYYRYYFISLWIEMVPNE